LDEKTLNTIEFPKVLDLVAQHTSFGVGKELVLSLRPETDVEDIRRLQGATTEGSDLLEIKSDLTLGGVWDIRGIVRRAQMGGMLEPDEFLDVASTLEWAQKIKGFILRVAGGANEFPYFAFQAKRIFNGERIENEIKRCINDAGEVIDSASPALRQIRMDVRSSHSTLLDRLQSILNASPKAFQEHVITMRNGRYVLPVKADFKGQVKGIIHDQSASGVTIFVEPISTVELNNRWRQAQIAEEKEVERILQDLATLLAAHADELLEMISALGQMDLTLAKARYSRLTSSVEPVIGSGDKGSDVLEFINARHPLLGRGVVPITVRLGGDYHTLVVTGPNTGGKTVALKTAGLLTVMAQCGLHIPADHGSGLPVFHHVFADIGDEQSIEQSLSTFSSHMSNIIYMLEAVDNRSLILLDEIGAGTDPAEGSALARAILSYLAEHGAYVIATTHYSGLKSYAYATPGVENASVEFDPETLAPKYRLIIGIPGRSNAITIASRLGLNREITGAAKELLDPGEVQIDTLLGQIQDERKEAERQRHEAQRTAAECRVLKDQAEKRLHQIELEKNEMIEQVRDEALQRIEDLRERLLAIERDAENVAVTREWMARAREETKAVAKQVQVAIPRRPRPKPQGQQAKKLEAGDAVKMKDMDMVGEILAISEDGKYADVQLGSFKTRVPIDDLISAKRERERKAPDRQVVLNVARDVMPSIEIDLRGKRAEEIDAILDRYINDAYLSGMQNIRIIHGKGTGVLRQVVRDILTAHPLVAGYETAARESGGEGATEATLVSRMEVAANGRKSRKA
jgi:DNA mismatch repair protein MutS2